MMRYADYDGIAVLGRAEKLGVLGNVEVAGEDNWREVRVFDGKGRLIGWKRVQSGHFHSVNSANAYLTIRG